MDEAPDRARRRMLAWFAAGAAAPFSPAQARGDAGHVLCGYPPGGSVDLVARKAADKLAAGASSPFVVDNRSGAAGRLAVMELRKAPADGRTLLVTPVSVVTLYPHVYAHLGYDPLRDLAPVCAVTATAFVLAVGPKVPAGVQDLHSFLAWCRAAAAPAQCGNAGAGSMPHLLALLVARETGVPMEHVPFRGGNAAMQAVAAGDLGAAIGTESSALGLAQAGRLRVLGVTTDGRSGFFPQVPSFAELGWPALRQREWFGVFAPAGTPADRIRSESALLLDAFAQPDARALLERNALQPEHLGPDAFAAGLKREYGFWGPIVRASGFRPES